MSTYSTCLLAKHRGEPLGLLRPLTTPSRPWSVVSMDFITDLPPSKGKDTILVVVDSFSKQAHFVRCAGLPSAKTLAKLFLNHVIRLHSFLDKVVSDRSSQSVANFWWEFLEMTSIDGALSSNHHQQTDGQTERVNQVLKGLLRCYCNFQQDDWTDLLPFAEHAYNNSIHTSTGHTPFHV